MLSIIAKKAVGRIVLGAIASAILSGGAAAAAPPATVVRLLTEDITVAADGASTQNTHYEIQANTDAAALKVGQATLTYDASLQTLEVVEAHTLKPDGKTIAVNPEAIYDSTPGGQAATVSGIRAKVVVFPQFAAGDVAVYTVKAVARAFYFPNVYWYTEVYSRAVEFDEVRETITAPRSFPLFVENHDVDFSKSESGDMVVYRWHYASAAPEPPQLRPVSPLASQPRFLVTSLKDYAELGRLYAQDQGEKIVVSPAIATLAGQITQGAAARRDQVKALYEWVSRHIRYVAIELGRGSFVPHDPEAVIANGYGDCKDHVALLGALLKAKGIDSQSVLINAGNEYALPQVATFATLNHAITYVPEFGLYLDSSVPVAPFGALPLEEYGKPAVRATPTDAQVVTLPAVAPGEATVVVKTDTHIDAEGELVGTTTTTATGLYGIVLRFTALGIQNTGSEAAAAQQLASLGYTGATGNFDTGTPADLGLSYTVSGSFVSPGWSDKLGGGTPFYIPGGLRLFSYTGDGPLGPLYPGSLKDSEAVVCFNAHISEDLSFRLPANVRLAKVPPDTSLQTANLRFTAHWTLADGTLRVHRDFVSSIDRAVCTADIRAQNAAALKGIVDNYDTTLTLERMDGEHGR